ncbi:hypothetical protein SG34_007720 [Thalassomonas viridans]|uniref:Uncharacterized protein n=1 Tax=Thalassomonas viridans TaxID=137584 RepID=A0AAF0CAX2_9GAMM|nr:hypothetical protein [Thalassomonas viridans]WDE06780.1 hypothetical protein SG34_007720 [Thalassomonas viridans]
MAVNELWAVLQLSALKKCDVAQRQLHFSALIAAKLPKGLHLFKNKQAPANMLTGKTLCVLPVSFLTLSLTVL